MHHLFWGVLLAFTPCCSCISSSEGAVSGLVGRENVSPGHLFWAKVPLDPPWWWFWVVGVLTSNPGPLLPLFLFSRGQGASGSPFQMGGKARATCCHAVPLFPGFLTRLSSSCCFSEFPAFVSRGVSRFAAVPSRETAAGPGLLRVLQG